MTEVRVVEMKLTERQRKLCELIFSGFNDENIAKELKITKGTLKQMLHSIYRTNDIKNRDELMYKFNIWSRTVRVGDVRESISFGSSKKDIYVITFMKNGYGCMVFNNGFVSSYGTLTCHYKDKLIKHYDTWQEAIASKEFKGD